MRRNKQLLAAILVIFGLSMQYTFAQTTKPTAGAINSQPSATKVTGHVEQKATTKVTDPLLDPSNPLGITYVENLINKTTDLIKKNRLSEAKLIIEPAMPWIDSATEYHTNLFKALREIDTATSQAELERNLALKFAILRDQASYQLALLYIQDKKPQKAVGRLVDIVRSQPKTPLGFNAYQVLQQIGFTTKLQIKEDNTQNNDDKNTAK